MSSFVFNDFKKRYLTGEVPSADVWSFIPVADTFKEHFQFDDFRLDHYRTLSDFSDVSKNKNADYFTYTGKTLGDSSIGSRSYVDVTGNDFRLKGTDLIDGIPLSFKWSKVIDDGDLSNKPMFVSRENYENFLNFYDATVSGNQFIESYLDAGGFYFIRSKDELNWFAERSLSNNSIIGVIGDDFEGVISTSIGNEENPFNGILDGNYFRFTNISIRAQNTDNGIVGVLGKFGVVRNFKFINTTTSFNSIDCRIPITLSHIKNDGRDINCGLLVGRNYGRIENVDAKNLGTFNIYGCVPSVYSVTNKSDNYKWNETETVVRKKFDENNENFLYLNSFCINSPGNICPYVGYFNEGKFADDACFLATDLNVTSFIDGTYTKNFYQYFANWGKYITAGTAAYGEVVDDNFIDLTFRVSGDTVMYNPLGNFYTMSDLSSTYIVEANMNNDNMMKLSLMDENSMFGPVNNNLQTFIKNPLYYGLDNFGFYTVRGIGKLTFAGGNADTRTWAENYNSNLCQKVLGTAYRDDNTLEPSYELTRASMRLHPQARAAYNVGTLIGANFGSAFNIQVSAKIKNTSNFVGFIGGLAGKQANGLIDNVIVSMNNELQYDFGSIPSAGDIVYYKQTPIFPECVKNYIEANLTANTAYCKNIISAYCRPWHDVSTDYSNMGVVTAIGTETDSTAKVITEDVISYKLRPIFVIGGLFGRYIPTCGTDVLYVPGTSSWDTMHCIVNNSTVIYKDNYYETVDSAVKRPENAFGALIGKVDYAITTNGIYTTPSIAFNNCNISADGVIGEPFRILNNYYDSTLNEWTPIVSATEEDPTLSAILSGECIAKYIGVYELKNNVIDPISYITNNAYTADAAGLVTGWTTDPYTPQAIHTPFNQSKKSLSEVGIYWGTDYPIDLSSHGGGIVKSHNMLCYMNQNDPDLFFMQAYGSYFNTITSVYGPWDINHSHYIEPNFDVVSMTGGYSKEIVSMNLVRLNGCYSNIGNWSEMYADYVNNWKYMELPPYIPGMSQIDPTHLANNTFTTQELYIIRKYWNRIGTKYRGYVNNPQRLSAANNLNWDNTVAPFTANSGLYTEGLMNEQINVFVRLGTQNTYDGYTTEDIPRCGWYNGIDANPYTDILSNIEMSPVSAYERNIYLTTKNRYNNPRQYTKNIKKIFNSFWNVTPKNDITWYDAIPMINRKSEDNYYYYTYEATSGANNKVDEEYCSMKQAFGFTIPVEFTAHDDLFGYKATSDDYIISNYISIGESYTPTQIRNKINTSELYDENDRQYFTTTSVSSDKNFGGFLVVDSSGRNVMFLDNVNNSPLTGNAISFPTRTVTTKDKSKENIILRVQ